jgi:hypothetical protein
MRIVLIFMHAINRSLLLPICITSGSGRGIAVNTAALSPTITSSGLCISRKRRASALHWTQLAQSVRAHVQPRTITVPATRRSRILARLKPMDATSQGVTLAETGRSCTRGSMQGATWTSPPVLFTPLSS